MKQACPFCGSWNMEIVITRINSVSGNHFAANCNDCKAKGPQALDDPEDAENGWNTRELPARRKPRRKI